MTAAAYPGEVKATTGRNRGTAFGLIGAEQKIAAGAWIAILAGYWYNVTAVPTLAGRYAKCLKDVDNTGGAAGALAIEVQFVGNRNLELIANDTGSPVTATDLGEEVYFLDNNTVTASSGLLTSMIARFTDIRAMFIAHAAGTGTYHGTADGATYTIAIPTTAATLYSSCTSLRTSALTHVVKVSGSPAIHGAADVAAQGALSALITPTTLDEAKLFIETIARVLFGSTGHTTRTAPTVHGAADATNVLTVAASTAANSKAGRAWAFYQASAQSVDETRVFVEIY